MLFLPDGEVNVFVYLFVQTQKGSHKTNFMAIIETMPKNICLELLPAFRYPELFDFYTTQAEIATVLKVTPGAVSNWMRRGIPIKRALQIERMSGGHVKREHLLPHIFET
jgi:hypothetical protein